jgi:hypothetical protein
MSIIDSVLLIPPKGIPGVGVNGDYDDAISSLIDADGSCRMSSSPSLMTKPASNITSNNPIHSQFPPKIPCSLLVEIKQHQNQPPPSLSQLRTKIPCSLLAEIKQQKNQQQQGNQKEILDIVRGILHVAAANGDQCEQQGKDICSFLSPMKKKTSLAVVSSGIHTLSLDDDSDEEVQDEECQKGDAGALNIGTMADSPKRVNFEAKAPSIEYTLSRADMTHEEKRTFWLQDEEFALIRLRDGYLGNLAEQKQREISAGAVTSKSAASFPPITSSSLAISPSHWICIRGLEYKMKLGYLRIKDRRLEYLEKILIEQERQWDEHWDDGRNKSPFSYDDEAFAAACRDITTKCKLYAERVAANDRREVEEMCRAEEETKE